MRRILIAATAILFVISSCKKDDETQAPQVAPEITITTPEGGFAVDNMKWLRVNPVVKSDSATTTYLWTTGGDTLSMNKNLMYVFAEAGTYTLTFSAKNSIGTSQQQITVKVAEKTYENGIAKVYEYFPAPGQFVNSLPTWDAGDKDEQIISKAEEQLKTNGMISLGGFGGHVVVGFGHTVINKPDEYSFLVEGNGFANWAEPGIVMVSADANGNGLPDDEWYEIAGSEYKSPGTIHNYQITYYKPDENKEPTPDGMYQSDTTYIRWKDNQGKSGYISKNVFNTTSYYPQWKGDSITFTGTRLTSENIEDLSGEGTNYISPAFEFGYADNWENTAEKAAIKISWAVDKNGVPVRLPGIDFIKVYTGMRAEAGWLGEISTEVTGVKDLNLK
ncbi:PKD domain-containing protein [Chitinophaga sp. S165]|uniref:PKD domain-containing protein n=1 Tax=Chitinophaga sp. S165 TaxID=2135462 RepID=UPI000D711A4D|nr:PKD domain-containing protein [Chitinophaga sp. S165]PWV56875.1 PKD family protein [Chitinophaga sp. S165]